MIIFGLELFELEEGGLLLSKGDNDSVYLGGGPFSSIVFLLVKTVLSVRRAKVCCLDSLLIGFDVVVFVSGGEVFSSNEVISSTDVGDFFCWIEIFFF